MSRASKRVGTKNKAALAAKREAYYKRFRNGNSQHNGMKSVIGNDGIRRWYVV